MEFPPRHFCSFWSAPTWAVLAIFVVALGAVPARAQNTIHAASISAAAGGALPRDCKAQAGVLLDVLGRYPHPDQWQWVILCDDSAWNQFLARRELHRGGGGSSFVDDTGPHEVIYASTQIDDHLTCLRGTTLLRPDNPFAEADHVIAHELAHILLHTEDEDRAEQQALRWLKERSGRSRPGKPEAKRIGAAGQ